APGFVSTGFARHGDAGLRGAVAMALGRPFALSPQRGAQTSVFLASAPEVEGLSGGYYAKCRPAQMSTLARDPDAPARLWELSERLLASAGSAESGEPPPAPSQPAPSQPAPPSQPRLRARRRPPGHDP